MPFLQYDVIFIHLYFIYLFGNPCTVILSSTQRDTQIVQGTLTPTWGAHSSSFMARCSPKSLLEEDSEEAEDNDETEDTDLTEDTEEIDFTEGKDWTDGRD